MASAEAAPPIPTSVIQKLVLGVAVLRYLLPIATIPFIPALLPERILLLIFLRPGKEFLLLGGGLNRTDGVPPLLGMFLAYLPLMVVAVWAFFALGRLYGERLAAGDGPAWLDRVVPPDTLRQAQRVLERRGPAIAILGRVAAFPPTILAAAAGTSKVGTARFLVADFAGAVAAFVVTVGVGYGLGRSYETGGVWLTVGGVALFVAMMVLMTRWIRREAQREDAPGPPQGDPGA